MIRIIFLLSILVSFLSCQKKKSSSTVKTGAFFQARGSLIAGPDGNPVKLQGVAFGNEVWNDDIPTTHHSEEDFNRLKGMNMNTVRFYLNYKIFEDDSRPYSYKQAGWDWIDKNIAWAKKYGIYLILNMHFPQGGYQSQGKGDALWTNVEHQNRLTALWSAIAKRYKDESTVIGFGLVNEPVPVSSLSQWQQLAQRITNEIRKSDQNHILFIEKPIYIKNSAGENADLNFPIINDNNIAYEFHIYDPYQYTHQLFSWAYNQDGGKYPDETILSYANASWYTASFSNPTVPSGNSDWQYVEGEKYKVTDPKIKIGLPALVARNVVGTVYFDDISIKEYDAAGNFTGKVFEENPSTLNSWYYWSNNNSGSAALASVGRNDNSSFSITGSTDDCNLNNSNDIFIPKQGYYYQACGWMKGENVSASSACMLRTDFLTTSSPILTRNKAYLESILNRYINWSKSKNVPIYLGEFGTGVHCFSNNKGGLQWVSDMIDICKSGGLYFTYHAYHEDNFGLYFGSSTLPDPSNSNQPLINLLKQKLQ